MSSHAGTPGTGADSGSAESADLLELLTARLQGRYSPLLADANASMLLTDGGIHNWTVEIDGGRMSAHRGGPAHPTTTVTADLATLHDVVTGRRSGITAFLDRELTVRGNMTLTLEMDGLFPSVAGDAGRTFTRAVNAGGLETFYLEAGPVDAPPIVLIHGVTATNSSMLPLIPALAANYHVLAPDLPGHGGTQATRSAHGAEFLGNWLTAFLRETCDQPAVLIGNSLGGRTALQAALNSPFEVRALVLLCPAVAFRRLRQFVPIVRLVSDRFAALPVVLPHAVAVRGMRALFADPDRLPEAWYDAAVDEYLRVLSIRANRRSIFSAIRHIYIDKPFGEGGFWDRLPGLVPPALFVWGRQDVLVPAGFSRFVDAALPSARTVVLDDCGHIPQFELPERTASLALDFIADLDSRQPTD